MSTELREYTFILDTMAATYWAHSLDEAVALRARDIDLDPRPYLAVIEQPARKPDGSR